MEHFLYNRDAKENNSELRLKSALASYPEENLQAYMLSTKQSVETELEDLLKASKANLRPLLEYALLSEGKRLRPILVLLSAQGVGGNPKKVMPLALSFELMHTATLVHDDIIDQDISRRGMKTVCSKWSTNSAILAGDALIALSVNLASDFGPRIMRILSNTGFELCDGEYMDVTFSLENTTEQDYFAKIRKKSASLFRGAAHCGALAAEGGSSEIKALTEYGECFGMAYQLNDDLQDLLNKNQVSQDLENGVVTLPFLYTYERGDNATKELLRNHFGNRKITAATSKKINDDMEKIGAFRYCRTKIAEYSMKSLTSLEKLRASVFKNYLMHFFDYADESQG